MSISNEDTRIVFVGDGNDNSPYAVSFPVELATDIEMFYVTDTTGVEVSKVITADYTLSIASDSGSASLTLVIHGGNAAPATGETMVIRRDQPATQQTTYNDFDGRPALVTETDFDRNIKSNLTLQEQMDRTLRVAKGHPDANLPLDPLNMIGNAGKTPVVNDAETQWEFGVVSEDAVAGPADDMSTDNAIVRWDGTTGRLLQDSNVLIDDSDNISDAVNITGSGVLSMGADGTATHIIGKAKIGEGEEPDSMRVAHFDYFSTINYALEQVSDGETHLNSPSTILLTIATATKATIVAGSFTLASGVDLTLDGGDLEVSGIITAGSGLTIITNTDGTIIGSVVDKTLLSSQATATPVSGDFVLISDTSDTNNLKKVDASNFLNSGGEVDGPGPTVTNEAVAVFDGTGGLTIKEVGVTMSVAGAVAGVTTLTGSGVLSMAADGTAVHILSKTKIGEGEAPDSMRLAHFDYFTNVNFALQQLGTGVTYVNSPSSILLTIANVTKASVASGLFSIASGVDLTLVGGDLEVSAGTLHVINGSSGATADSSADDAIVETSAAQGGLSVLAPDASFGTLMIGSPTNATGFQIVWKQSTGTAIMGSRQVGADVVIRSDNNIPNVTCSGAAGSVLGVAAGVWEITDFLRTPTGGVLTISTNTITPTASFHTFTTSVGTINTITAGTAGDRFTIIKTSGAPTTVANAADNIKTTSGANITWAIGERLDCIYDGTDWYVTQLA